MDANSPVVMDMVALGDPRCLFDQPAGVVLEYNRTMMHHKIMIVDGLWSTVGTANFDNRSFSHNEESNVCVCDADFAGELTTTYERDAAVCQRVTRASWRRRTAAEKTMEALASFVQDQV